MRSYEVELVQVLHGKDVVSIALTCQAATAREAEDTVLRDVSNCYEIEQSALRVVAIREVSKGCTSFGLMTRAMDNVLRKLQAISKAVNAPEVLDQPVVVDSPIAAEHASPLDPVAQIEAERDAYRKRCEQLERRVQAIEAERAIEQQELSSLHARIDGIFRLISGETPEAVPA